MKKVNIVTYAIELSIQMNKVNIKKILRKLKIMIITQENTEVLHIQYVV